MSYNIPKGDERMSIASDIIRQHTDTIILSSLISKDSYGYEINKKIKNASDGKYELNEATLYTAFKRLEDSGCINSYWGNESSSARRKYYHITNFGIETCEKMLEEWQTAKKIIDTLINLEGNSNE